MKSKSSDEIINNTLVRKRLAKLMALHCFRNTKLEDFHAGVTPSSQTSDFSDVKVITPYGEILWNDLSRISDEEMKILMIDVVNHCYDFLNLLYRNSGGDTLIQVLREIDLLPEWNEPNLKELFEDLSN